MKTIQQLIETPRMFYMPLSDNNSVAGLGSLILEIFKPDFIVAEIGSFGGVSSDLFARHCETLYCIDVWDMDPTYQEIAPDLLTTSKALFCEVWKDHPNIRTIQTQSIIASQMFDDNYLDLVYIDARHDYDSVKADIQAWYPKIKKGGWLTGHDIDLDGERVQKAVYEHLGNIGLRKEYLKTYPDTSWAIQKT